MRAEQPAAAPPPEFLSRARRRYLTRELLGAAFASAAASLCLELAIRWAGRTFGVDMPAVSIGIVLFLVLGALALRRNRVDRVAARADRGLGLQDRLVTFLDFRDRSDVGQDFRRAQAGEAAAALARVDLTRGIRIPRLLWAAPLLFALMLYVDFFAFFMPSTPPFLVPFVGVGEQQRVATRAGGGPADGDDPHAGGAPLPERAAAPPGAAAPDVPGDGSPPAGEDRPADAGAPDAGPPGDPPRLADVPAPISEPARLYSEPVGAALTPVADATPARPPGAAPALPEPPLRGRISFNLVPVDGEASGPAGTGGKPGGGQAEGLEITVDYDAVPPEYRPHVRRYFNTLVRLFQGGTDGT